MHTLYNYMGELLKCYGCAIIGKILCNLLLSGKIHRERTLTKKGVCFGGGDALYQGV